ncbi:hypothetical protein ACFX1Z_019864 [Malus domestica]
MPLEGGGSAQLYRSYPVHKAPALRRVWERLIFHYGFRQYKLMCYQLLTLSDSTPLSTPSRSRTPPPIPQSSTAPP